MYGHAGIGFDYCFPGINSSGRVQQLGRFVVDLTAEKTSREILDAFTKVPKRRSQRGSQLAFARPYISI
jgi:hypothetical protein